MLLQINFISIFWNICFCDLWHKTKYVINSIITVKERNTIFHLLKRNEGSFSFFLCIAIIIFIFIIFITYIYMVVFVV